MLSLLKHLVYLLSPVNLYTICHHCIQYFFPIKHQLLVIADVIVLTMTVLLPSLSIDKVKKYG